MLFINYLRKTILYDEMSLIRDFLNALKKFGKMGGGKIKLYKKIRACHKRYDWEPEEYFAFHYEILTAQERWDYISEREHVRMANSFNTKESAAILFDKWKTYEVLKPFFKRKACLFRGLIDEENFCSLLKESGRLIIKPLAGSFGIGIKIVESESTDKDFIQNLASEYPLGFIAEQIIEQTPEMSQLHPESVNTLRIHTLRFGDQVEIFHPYIRIGRGNSIVDNTHSGGIFTSCNPQDGTILNVVDDEGNIYDEHPDNHFPLKQFKVPCWEEAFRVAKSLALQIPNLVYAGWDLALTPNGWVLVEGNPRAQLTFQISEGKGCYSDIEAILRKHGRKVEWKRFRDMSD